ncbi:MAG TPA: alpha/beta hydrolase [Steroidobacteraceae bacterium]|nr:alpha/beta hydrolase [Steroidobacteraceae bacterium]
MTALAHRHLEANGLRHHILEQGTGPLVLLCHGWPELSWSWRHQIGPLADAGFHVVAPDLRGFGETDAPREIDAYTMLHTVGDMVGLVHALGEEHAVIVGHDWGAQLAWTATLFRPDVFRAVAALSVPYAPRGHMSMLDVARKHGLHRFYMLYFQDIGVAEAVLEKDPHDALLRLIYSASGEIPSRREGWPFVIPENRTILDVCPRPDHELAWLPEADLRVYSDAYRRSGFRGTLNWYRCMDLTWRLMAPWTGMPIPVPAMFIGGEHDAVLRMPGLNTALENMPRTVPKLLRAEIVPGVGHWIQQEAPQRVTELLLAFLARPSQMV